MRHDTLGTVFSVWAVVAMLVGLALILATTPGAVAGIGAALVIVGAISTMPAARFTLLREDGH